MLMHSEDSICKNFPNWIEEQPSKTLVDDVDMIYIWILDRLGTRIWLQDQVNYFLFLN